MTTKARYRPRRQFKFLLYQDIEMELILTDFIQRLKKERRYVTVLRNGLRLMGSLMERDLSVLYELFPWIREAILTDNPPPTSAPDSGDIQRQIEAAVEAGVQKAMLSLPALPAGELVAAPVKESAASTNTLGQGVTFTAPPSDDDDDTVVVTKKEKHMGMLTAVLALMEGDATLSGKNLTAAENAKSLAARRLS